MFPILDYLARHAEQIAVEWFRLMGWLLIISALSLAGHQSSNIVIKALPWLSVCLLWLYVFFGFSERYFKNLPSLPADDVITIKMLIIRGAVASLVCSVLLILANYFVQIAIQFISTVHK